MRDPARPSEPASLGARGLIVLSLPSVLFAGFDLARRSYLPLFLTDEFSASMVTAATIMALTGIWGVAMEFIASACGDRGSRRIGPRPLWMVIGTLGIVGAACAILLTAGNDPARSLWGFVAFLMVLIASWTLCNVTHGAWALEAGRTGRQRAGIFGLRGFFAIAGATGFALLGAAISEGRVFAGIAPFVAIIGITGLGIPLLHALLVLTMPSPRPTEARPKGAGPLAPLLVLVANCAHRRLALLYGLLGLHAGIAGATFLITARAGFGLGAAADLVLGVSTASAALGTLASARWGAACRSELGLGLLMALKLLLALALLAIPRGEPLALAAWALVGGLFGTFHLLVLRLLLGECLDKVFEAAPEAGPRGALFYAAFHMPLNLGLAAGAALALASLGWAGFDPAANQIEQTSYVAVFIPSILLASVSLAGIFSVRGIDRFFGKKPMASTAFGASRPELEDASRN